MFWVDDEDWLPDRSGVQPFVDRGGGDPGRYRLEKRYVSGGSGIVEDGILWKVETEGAQRFYSREKTRAEIREKVEELREEVERQEDQERRDLDAQEEAQIRVLQKFVDMAEEGEIPDEVIADVGGKVALAELGVKREN